MSTQTHYSANSLGIRGPEWPERTQAFRVLCVGGSTTECLFLDDTETWPRLVADALAKDGGHPCWVGDVGRSGFASADHLRLLENDALLSQIDCLLILVGINDLQQAMKGRRLDRPFGVRPLFERSAVFRVIDQLHNERRTRRRHMDETQDAGTYQKRRDDRASMPLASSLPDLSASRGQYRKNLETIIDVCKKRGLRLHFATQPVLWKEGIAPADEALLWLGTLADRTRPPVGWLAQQMTLFNDCLRDVCRERGVGLIDLAALDGDPASFYDDCHFTIVGAQRVAAAVADALRER